MKTIMNRLLQQNWKYQFSDEIVRNQDRVCIGYAKVWKKDDDPSKYYTVLISSANADEVMCHMEVGKGIEFHIAMA